MPDKLVIGCGYIGGEVAEQWRQGGARVYALTRSAAHAARFRERGLIPVVGDVLQPETLRALPDAETVLYAVGLDRAAGHSQREVYVDGLAHVLAEIGGRIGQFVYVSSTSVYGQNGGEWVDEESPCSPTSPNGQVCLEAEQVVWRSLPAGGPVRAQVLRLAGIYGPGRLVARVDALRNGEPLRVQPQGWLNLIHRDDAVAAVLAAEARGTAGATYLVSDDRPVLRSEFYAEMAQLIGAPAPVFAPEESLPEAERSGRNKRCCNRRLREELGVSLQWPTIREGLRQALAGP